MGRIGVGHSDLCKIRAAAFPYRGIRISYAPRITLPGAALALSTAILLLAITAAAPAQEMRRVYERAEKFLPANASKHVLNLSVEPSWVDGSDRFVYRRQLPGEGKLFLLVNPEQNTSVPAFDHARLAAALPPAEGKTYTATTLPFERVTLAEKQGTIEFSIAGKPWSCTLADYRCSQAPERDPGELVSPDGKSIALVRDHNLYVRSAADGRERPLTTDGTEECSYGTSFTGNDVVSVRRLNRKPRLQAAWSPDSARLYTYRMDQRGVGMQHLFQSVPDAGFAVAQPRRPIIHSWRYPMAGDQSAPLMELMVFDVAAGKRTDIRIPRLPQLRPVMQSPASGLFASRSGSLCLRTFLTQRQVFCGCAFAGGPASGQPAARP